MGPKKHVLGCFRTTRPTTFRKLSLCAVWLLTAPLPSVPGLRDGRQVARPFTAAEFGAVGAAIAQRLQELSPLPTAAAPARGNAAPNTSGTPEIVGRSYSVELRSGNSFIGVLLSATPEELEFETKDLGSVRVQRPNLVEFVLLSEARARRGFDDVGNGTRLFFAPTARNLRRGEGYVQDINIFLLGANYGITDNFSVGVLVPVLPNFGAEPCSPLPPSSAWPSPINSTWGRACCTPRRLTTAAASATAWPPTARPTTT
jgi:hypothetical protein